MMWRLNNRMLSMRGILISLGKHLSSLFSLFLSVSGALILKRTELQKYRASAVVQSAACLTCASRHSIVQMRIPVLPCLTFVLYFYVLNCFKILVYAAVFQLTCMHIRFWQACLCVRVCVCVHEREGAETQWARDIIYSSSSFFCLLGAISSSLLQDLFSVTKPEVFICSVLHTERSHVQLQRSLGTPVLSPCVARPLKTL